MSHHECVPSQSPSVAPLWVGPRLAHPTTTFALAPFPPAGAPATPTLVSARPSVSQCGGELCPDIVSYNTVIKACGNAHQVELGLRVGGEGRVTHA